MDRWAGRQAWKNKHMGELEMLNNELLGTVIHAYKPGYSGSLGCKILNSRTT